MLRDRSHVEDILQTSVALAFSQFDRYVDGTSFKAWVFRIVTLEVFNRNRKHEPVPLGEVSEVRNLPAEESWDLIAQEGAFDAMLDDPDSVLLRLDDEMAEALERLPLMERAVLLLRAIGDFSYREIHEQLSIPVGSVIGCLSRARKRLRITLAGYARARGLFHEKDV